MGYYDIYDGDDNLLASNVWLDESGYGGGKASADDLTISAAILYFLGFIGMGIMLFNIPAHFLFMGIIAVIIYALPAIMVLLAVFLQPFAKKYETQYFDEEDEPLTYHLCHMLTGGGGIVKNILRNFIAPHAFWLFNLFLALFWICYPMGSVAEQTLIGIVIPSAYSMYYYPFVLIRRAVKSGNKLYGVVAGVIIALSFGLFLINYNTFMQTDSVIGIAFLFTMLTVLGTLTILVGNLILSKKKIGKAILLAFYITLVIAVAAVSFIVIPKQNEERYNEAIKCVEAGEYKEARELFAELGKYKDSEERYKAIKFINLELGEKVIMGTQTDSPDDPYGENPLSWTVIAVNGNKALVLSDAILTSIDSNPLEYWNKGNNVRSALKSMEGLFSDEEKARINQHTYDINAKGSSLQVTDKLFLLSKAELEQYCKKEQIFSEKDTTYNDHQVLDYQMADFDYIYVYTYYVCDTNAAGEWMIADCEAGQFVTKNTRYVGIRPAMYITLDEVSE